MWCCKCTVLYSTWVQLVTVNKRATVTAADTREGCNGVSIAVTVTMEKWQPECIRRVYMVLCNILELVCRCTCTSLCCWWYHDQSLPARRLPHWNTLFSRSAPPSPPRSLQRCSSLVSWFLRLEDVWWMIIDWRGMRKKYNWYVRLKYCMSYLGEQSWV